MGLICTRSILHTRMAAALRSLSGAESRFEGRRAVVVGRFGSAQRPGCGPLSYGAVALRPLSKRRPDCAIAQPCRFASQPAAALHLPAGRPRFTIGFTPHAPFYTLAVYFTSQITIIMNTTRFRSLLIAAILLCIISPSV